MDFDTLTEREHQVLEAIVRNYIMSASPTSSRYLSKQSDFDISAASIRNVMYDLEDRGFITQPHTSAGRIPTDKGYRYYVDCLMKYTGLPEETKEKIRRALVTVDQSDLNVLLSAASRALSRTTNLLGVILAPKLCNGLLQKLHVFPIGSQRYLLNLALESGFVKTMVFELETEIPQERLEYACRIITSKMAGKTLHQICETDDQVFIDVPEFDVGIVRLLVPSIKKMVENDNDKTLYAEGETNVILQPEFFNREKIGAVIEILGEKNLLMHLFEAPEKSDSVVISIGGENQEGQLQSFSIIKTSYRVGHMAGSLGVIGPKRMPYPFLVSAVEYTARVLSELHS